MASARSLEFDSQRRVRRKERENTYFGKVWGFSTTVTLSLKAGALLAIHDYPPALSMTIQLNTPFTFTTSNH